jgi:ABC-2 type transport system ATP-binding protein
VTETRSPAISVRGLVKRYGGRAVVDGIDLDVRAGEVFALLGPNGAGKTTTVEIIEGYRKRDDGIVSVLGLDPALGGPGLRARVGLMLQGGGVDPRARPAEILRLYAAFHADARDPRELIPLVGLDNVSSTPYRHLSGGERQRLGFALALVGRPELLILDEPTAGMDPAARASTRGLIRMLRDEGIATLLTTHDLGDVERVADWVAILDSGRIVATGTPAELVAGTMPRLVIRFARPLSEEEFASLASNLGDAGEVAVAPGDQRQMTVLGPAPDPRLVERVASWAAARSLLITRLETSGGSLEDRYLELTGDLDVTTGAGPPNEPDLPR